MSQMIFLAHSKMFVACNVHTFVAYNVRTPEGKECLKKYTVEYGEGENVYGKQPSEVFLEKSCSQKFRKMHRKTPLLESFFNNDAGLQAFNFIKKRL